MLLSDAITSFLSALATERAASEHTITGYRIALRQFSTYVQDAWGAEPAVEDISEADINPLIVSETGAVAVDARFVLG